MKRIDTRALLSYMALGVTGLFLLMLVMVNITGYTSSRVFFHLFTLLPLFVVAAFLALLLGSSRPTKKVSSHKVSSWLGRSAAVGMLASVAVTYISTKVAPSTLKFLLENIGVALLFLAYACTLFLMDRQKFVYWPFWNKDDKKHADERQKAVRNRVFEKSYRINLLAVLVAGWLAEVPSQRMHDELYQVAIVCLLGLPAIIASWQKDS